MPKTRISWPVIMLLLLAIVKLAILAWSVDKGFEMTDEGYYLLWFHCQHLYAPDLHLNYYYIVQMFFGWIDWDITVMRIGGIITEVGAVAALGWGLTQYIRSRLPQLYSPNLIATLFIGGICALFMAEHPRSLSYDSVTHLLMGMGGGIVLWWLSLDEKPKGWKVIGFFGLLGFVLAAQLVVKFSSAILLGGLWAVVCLAYKRSQRAPLAATAAVLVGIVLTFAGLFITINPAKFWVYYQIGYQRIAELGYSPFDILLQTYLAKDVWHFTINLGPALLAVIIGLLAFKSYPPAKRITGVMGLGLVVFVLQVLILPTDYFPQWHYRFIDLMLLLIISGTIVLWRVVKPSKEIYVAIVVLFCIPFVCAIGSAVNLAMSLFSYLPSWILLVILLWEYIRQQTGITAFNILVRYGTVLGCFGIFLWVFIWPNYLPHGMAAPMYEQTQTVVAHDGVKLDAPTAKFVTDTKQLLADRGFQPGNYLLALYDLPGLVYLLEGYSPQVLWYFGETTRATTQEAVDNTCWHIKETTESNVYVIKPVTVHPDVAKCLSFSKLHFPEAYVLAGMVYNTYCKCDMEVWAPKR